MGYEPLSAAERSPHPTSEESGAVAKSARLTVQEWPRGAAQVRGQGGGREELPGCRDQWRPGGNTPHPRSGRQPEELPHLRSVAAGRIPRVRGQGGGFERSYPTWEARAVILRRATMHWKARDGNQEEPLSAKPGVAAGREQAQGGSCTESRRA